MPGGHDTSVGLPWEQSAAYTTKSGSLATTTLSSATGVQLSTTRDVQSHTPVTMNPGVATTATCAVAVSPDNVTYSTLCTWTVPVGTVLDGFIFDVATVVPAGWYLRLTVSAQATIGTTTYF